MNPEEAMRHDRMCRPTGYMVRFKNWIGKRWDEWYKLRGLNPKHKPTKRDHDDFDTWLKMEGYKEKDRPLTGPQIRELTRASWTSGVSVCGASVVRVLNTLRRRGLVRYVWIRQEGLRFAIAHITNKGRRALSEESV